MTVPKPTGARGHVLVAYASKMGGTAGIAATVAEELRARGVSADVMSAADVHDVEGYGTVVLGSALYIRRWRPDAVRFLKRHARALRDRDVWLFQSGPCGQDAVDPDQPEPANVARLRRSIDARPPVTFGGVLDPATARGFLARRMASGELAGDFRDPERIRRWAAGIGAAVNAVHPSGQ
ncbi:MULTISPECIES: flavodoxin domain-containing protein [unclassified Pseudonocardia]|jgi:menaquinone-dependent protoporphyrinogen oxidase|uniref:flavodoxin domain-containing protein n=1 Tax=unclassified Pseudonocardia TaxID=2619320 RepID=UPI000968776D|nr:MULTISPECIES: flavodoxin domain-containing protein [unclassified Pseudonocardia]MBN9101050.1 flavodoxin [Pseudonocardia sp.]OJY53976.1 MAG: hypothetical protein BGP03_19670 [Pseudonocardia sp. 73-21]